MKLRQTKIAVASLAVVLGSFGVAACSSSPSAATSNQGSATPPASSSGSSTTATSGSSNPATGTAIQIKNFAFSPATLTVKPGASITATNADSVAHTVTASGSAQGAFDTGDIAPGASKSFTAPTKAGTYPYICSIHPFMHGTLIVK